ncbi:MAG: zf-HC2 domain-containing protein [Longimicrobiales bacterium]
MDCREFLLRYSDYDDSLLPAHEAARFRAHMAECPSCARYDRVLRKGRMVARQIPEPEPSPDFLPRLQLRLREVRSRRRWPGARLAAGLAAVTVLVVAASAVSVLDVPGTASSAPETAVGGATPAVTSSTASGAPAPPTRVRPASASVRRAVTALPAVEPDSPRGWMAKEVAPAVVASYSPLETGPPSYRRRLPSSRGPTDSERRALD